jgi:ABC-2 type transport system permease protein
MSTVIRALSFIEQWLAEVLRSPALMFTLIVAPFLLLFAFGQGVKLTGPRPVTLLVQDSRSEHDITPLLDTLEDHVIFAGVTESLPLAHRALRRGDIDAIVLVPDAPEQRIDAGEQVDIVVYTGEIDPVRRSYARAYMRDQVTALNQRTIGEVFAAAQTELDAIADLSAQAREYYRLLVAARDEFDEARLRITELRETLQPLVATVENVDDRTQQAARVIPGLGGAAERTSRLRDAVSDLQASVQRIDARLAEAGAGDRPLPSDEELSDLESRLEAIDDAVASLGGLSPEIVSSPFRLVMEDVTPVAPSFTMFYSPGVLALLVQHLAITLAALTMSHMRLLRVTDMLRVSPIRPSEVVIGNYIAYALITAIAAAALVALIVTVLNVPVSGSYLLLSGTLALLILVSLGLGFVISLLSATTQQATQIAMLILLGSIFFSGFAFSLDQISWPAQGLAYAFPATYGIRTLQDVMLRGLLREPLDLVILGVFAIGLFALTVFLMRRELRAE